MLPLHSPRNPLRPGCRTIPSTVVHRRAPVAVLHDTSAHNIEEDLAELPDNRPHLPGADLPVVDPGDGAELDTGAREKDLVRQKELRAVQPPLNQCQHLCGNLLHGNVYGRYRPMLGGCRQWLDNCLEAGKLKRSWNCLYRRSGLM